MPSTSLDTADAIELAELLQFLDDWLATDPGQLGASLARFTGSQAYGIQVLRDDLARFTFCSAATTASTSSDTRTRDPGRASGDRGRPPGKNRAPRRQNRDRDLLRLHNVTCGLRLWHGLL